MKNLQGKHVFKVARIINKAKLGDKIAGLYTGKKQDVNKLGYKILMTIVESAGEEGVDKEVFALLDELLEVKNSAEMDVFELIDLLKLYGQQNDVKSFLSKVVSLMNV